MRKYFIPFFVIFVLIFGLLTAIYLSKQTANVKNKAAVTGGTGTLSLTPVNGTHYVGESFPISIYFNSGGASISAVTFRITYPYTGTLPQLDVVDQSGNSASQVLPNTVLTQSGWSFSVNSVTRASNIVTIDMAAINANTAGFATTSPVLLATLNFKVNAAYSSNPLVLGFDTNLSKIVTKADATDILGIPTNASYTIIADTTPPSPITDLTGTTLDNQSVSLSWTAPADMGPTGKASSYIIHYSTTPITSTNWSSATNVSNNIVPGGAGTKESFTVSSLNPNTTYYFAIESSDASGNISGLSNVTQIKLNANYTLNFKFKLQSLTHAGSNTTLSLRIMSGTTSVFLNNSINVVSDATGTYSGSVDLGNITAGTYDIYIKEPTHLRKRFPGINIIAGSNNIDLTATPLLAGDFNNDNQINILDLGKILSVYTALRVPVNPANQIYDVNADNQINILDIGIVLSNYTALVIYGD